MYSAWWIPQASEQALRGEETHIYYVGEPFRVLLQVNNYSCATFGRHQDQNGHFHIVSAQ